MGLETTVNTFLNTNEIVPNKINPNHMADSVFEKLKLSIKKFGMLNPIIVRKLESGTYEILDGEWRWRASKDLKLESIPCKIIEASDDDVAKIILASTIKGKHNFYENLDIVKDLAETETSESLKAMNLDKAKLERKLKYSSYKKASLVSKTTNKKKEQLRDETSSPAVKEIIEYSPLLIFSLDKLKYDKVLKALEDLDSNLEIALLKLVEFYTNKKG